MNNEPRKLSVLLDLCLHAKPSGELRYGMCVIASELWHHEVISLEELKIVQVECMKLVSETHLQGDYSSISSRYVRQLYTALSQRLQCHRRYLEDMCYLVYSCWIDKLESEGK